MTIQKNAARVAVKAAACPNAAAQVTPSDEIGMAWYNNCSEAERARWHAVAGSAVPADAYRAFYEQTTIQTAPSAPIVPDLPTMQQAMRLACAVATDSLSVVTQHASNTWSAGYRDAINAAELALDAVHRLGTLPRDWDEFDFVWSCIKSVVRLARDAFPDKDCAIGLSLSNAVREFEVLHNMVDILAEKEAQEGGAV